jgi:hypothetical protein
LLACLLACLLAKIVAANVILSSLFSLFFEGTSRPDGTPFKYGTNGDESMQRRVTSFYNTIYRMCEIHPEVGVKQPDMGRKKASPTSDARKEQSRPPPFHAKLRSTDR